MTIEVRQMVIRSTVDPNEHPQTSSGEGTASPDLERIKAEILAECMEMLREKLRDSKER